MRSLKFIVPGLILSSGLMLSSITSYAKPEYVKSTKKACGFCHIDAKVKPKELTDAGKYFKEHNSSLDGYSKGS